LIKSEAYSPTVVEVGLGSVAKLKILRIMLKRKEHAFSFYELEQKVSVNSVSIRAHIADLKEVGWVEEFPYTPRKYKVNLGNDAIKRVLALFESTGYV
jgi:Fic family protein